MGPFQQVMALGVEMPGEWRGRLFLVDPHVDGDRMNALALGQRIVRQIGPTVYNVYLLRRLRSRSAANERGRVARELHDGIVQSVLGVQIQLHALSEPATGIPRELAGELTRLGTILRDEVVNLRDLMQRLKPLELNGDQLMDALAHIVQRFQRETGINARFITRFDRIDLPPLSCIEVTRVVQEALVNVRKHSGARNACVRLDIDRGICRLTIDDDGRGFPFSGRMTQTELEHTGQGPWIIKDRVRLLGGQMAVDSAPGQGSRLEISFPITTYVHG
jgi:signal transduction histidine kinase